MAALDVAQLPAVRRDAAGRAGGAWLKAGEPARAVSLLEAELARGPGGERLETLLEQARAAAAS